MDEKHVNGILYLIAALSLVALIFSALILVEKKIHSPALDNFCSALPIGNQCNVVQQSKYGNLFGIDNPWFGIAGFLLLIILSIVGIHSKKHSQKARVLVVIGGILSGFVALWLLYVQTFLLHAFCIFCLFVDAISLVLLVINMLILSHIMHPSTAKG